MFGWEFPPFHSGGLGTACYGLTKGLYNHGVDVTFVVPRLPEVADSEFVKLVAANETATVIPINSPLQAYMTEEEYTIMMNEEYSPTKTKSMYGGNLFSEVKRYAQKAQQIAEEQEHDIIHAHDWMTYQAGYAAKKISGKPLVLHIHATEFDRTGGNGLHPFVHQIEREGFENADKIIAVSRFTKRKLVEKYNVNPDKIEVVHNAVELTPQPVRKERTKNVLFLGRVTLQKGPDYFISAAKRVLELRKDVTFIMAGSGDMQRSQIEKAAELGIGDKILFTGFLRGKDVDKAYQMADLYVMPSVSEPFGITPLESLNNNVPVLISKQSGVSEVLHHCLKVDFWDIDEMASKIISVLDNDILWKSLRKNGAKEVSKFSWNEPASKCVNVYDNLMVKVEG